MAALAFYLYSDGLIMIPIFRHIRTPCFSTGFTDKSSHIVLREKNLFYFFYHFIPQLKTVVDKKKRLDISKLQHMVSAVLSPR